MLRLLNHLQGALLLLAIMACGSTDAAMKEITEQPLPRNLDTLATNPIGAIDLYEQLFKEGTSALPLLVKGLSDTREFAGICGQISKQSHAEEISPNNNVTTSENSVPTVGEASLYLIVAILRQDLYFAWNCRVSPPTNRPEAVAESLLSIQAHLGTLLERGSMTKARVEAAMLENSLKFPKKGAD